MQDSHSLAGAAGVPGEVAISARYPILPTLDRMLALASEVPAAILVALEILILLAGVTSRYVFNSPLTWSDELASILFLWLAMLGAVIALRRGEHMRLTTLVNRLQPAARGWVQLAAQLVVATFVLEIILPAYEYFQDQWMISSPALEIHDGLRVAAIGVGAVMMMAIALIRLLQQASGRQLAVALACFGLLCAALWMAQPLFFRLGNINLLIFFVGVVAVCVACGVPIAFAFGVATLSYLALTTQTPLTIVVSRMDEGMSALILLSVPLFVFLGLLIEMTGLARAMVDFLASLLGHVRGGLAYVLLGAMYLVSGISGSKAADMAAVAPALLPEMKRRGAEDGRLIALLSSSGAMSETIPPSLVLITIGSVTGVSIAALFAGGLLPALIGALALAVVVFFHTRNEDLSNARRASVSQILKLFFIALPALALPFVIRTVVAEGIATATEVSTVGIAYTFVVGLLIYRRFDWSRIYPMLVETASLSGAILFIIGCATAMAWGLTQSGFSRLLAESMSSVPVGKAGFMVISVFAFVILGSVLEGIPAIVLFGPLLFPVARAVGIHEVHYAMVVVFAMGLGLFAPPFGVGFYAACAIGRVNPDHAMKYVWPYLGALFVALILIAAVPWISTGFL
ncbi:TRAP transporter large permease subunit [Undibacterium sp.]|uniref:TRAP transporter large permease n=1 Tax=Undibacterium sp. TaxID=1914977 RepID=UPI0039C8E05A